MTDSAGRERSPQGSVDANGLTLRLPGRRRPERAAGPVPARLPRLGVDVAAPAPLSGGGGLPGGGPVAARVCADDRTRRRPLPSGGAGPRRLRAARGAGRRRRRRADRPRLGGAGPYSAVHEPSTPWRRLVTMAVPPPATIAATAFFSYDQLHGRGTCSSSSTRWPTWRCRWTTSPSSTAVGRLVAGLRRRRGPAARQGRPARPRQPGGRHRLLPGDARRRGLDDRPEVVALQKRGQRRSAAAHALPARRTDGCMGADLAGQAGPALTHAGSRVELVDGAGHFLHLERPDDGNRLVLDFLAAARGSADAAERGAIATTEARRPPAAHPRRRQHGRVPLAAKRTRRSRSCRGPPRPGPPDGRYQTATARAVARRPAHTTWPGPVAVALGGVTCARRRRRGRRPGGRARRGQPSGGAGVPGAPVADLRGGAACRGPTRSGAGPGGPSPTGGRSSGPSRTARPSVEQADGRRGRPAGSSGQPITAGTSAPRHRAGAQGLHQAAAPCRSEPANGGWPVDTPADPSAGSGAPGRRPPSRTTGGPGRRRSRGGAGGRRRHPAPSPPGSRPTTAPAVGGPPPGRRPRLGLGRAQRRPSQRARTRPTLVSTTPTGRSKANASTARAVYGPTPGRASSASRSSGRRPPCRSTTARRRGAG